MKCPNCGKVIAKDSKFCEFCGAKISKPKKIKVLWIVLFALLGMSALGVGLFYVCDLQRRYAKEVAETKAAQEKVERAQEELRIAQEKAEAESFAIDSLRNVISQTDDKILLVSDDNFGDFDSISFRHLVIIDYYGKWCEPCRRLDPALYEVVKEYHGQLIVGRYIVDDFKERYVKRYNVTGIPTLLFLLNGREVNRIVGYCEKQTIKDAINSALQVGNNMPVAEPQNKEKDEQHFDASDEAKKKAEAAKRQADEEKRKLEQAKKKAEDMERKAAEEKKKAERAYKEKRKKELIQQGYVDLGLPSKTLWKSQNEGNGFFSYEQAMANYGNFLPTNDQYAELQKYCKWNARDGGMEFIGPNGNTLFLPGEAFRDYSGNIKYKSPNGAYWARTTSNEPWSIELWGVGISSGTAIPNSREARSVRLVRNY